MRVAPDPLAPAAGYSPASPAPHSSAEMVAVIAGVADGVGDCVSVGVGDSRPTLVEVAVGLAVGLPFAGRRPG